MITVFNVFFYLNNYKAVISPGRIFHFVGSLTNAASVNHRTAEISQESDPVSHLNVACLSSYRLVRLDTVKHALQQAGTRGADVTFA